MGGKTSSSSSQVSVPPEVLARYSNANNMASNAAATPFQQYSTDPAAFVAQFTPSQQQGLAGVNSYANSAQPYFGAATQSAQNALNLASPYTAAANQSLAAGQDAAGQLQGTSGQNYQNAYNSAQPYNSQAASYYNQGLAAAQPYNAAANQNISNALGIGNALGQDSYASLAGANAGANPLNQSAAQGIAGAYQGAQPYQQGATAYALQGGQAVDPNSLDVQKYLSPYLDTVLQGTAGILNQNNQQAMSGQLGNAISSGAFGGDRAGIAAANLSQQQNLANSQIYSGILNQGYSQALGAAQQQQGVDLSAGQANRAATQSTADRLAAIGQQGYTQGMGSAAAQAALAQQIFGQGATTAAQQAALGQQLSGLGLSASQAQSALGQQIYGQNAATGQGLGAIGQQQYSQGMGLGQAQQSLAQQQYQQALAASQQQSALGQQTYDQNSGLAQMLASLGTQSQTAGLQGAQAQMAAGQQQQETNQAGQTALYNQFLQQQSYPFQVAQFLANIAMGTGSLSGSTTTTQQPGGFFSDERLKEDIEPIGETYDGQKIVKYRYKDGDPRKRIGLLAQDVEKRHPDAVGLAAGYKTVDYDKATQASAERGEFAKGGIAAYDPEEVLGNRSGSFGPYLTGAGGHMYGNSLRVPTANLPVKGLMIAKAPPQPGSMASQVRDIADIGTGARQGYEWLKGLGRDDEDGETKKAHGGAVGLAAGGMPYSGMGLDIPDEQPDLTLAQTGPLGAPQSGASQLANVAKTASAAKDLWKMGKTAAKIFAGGMAEGGEVKPTGLDPEAGENALLENLLEALDTEPPEREEAASSPVAAPVAATPQQKAVEVAKEVAAPPPMEAGSFDPLKAIDKLERSGSAAKRMGIDVNDVTSPAGAMGRYQIMPGTAKQYMGKDFDPGQLRDPKVNEQVARTILRDLMGKYRHPDGSPDMQSVYIAYNAGPGRANSFIKSGRDASVLPKETQGYIGRAADEGLIDPAMRVAMKAAGGAVDDDMPDLPDDEIVPADIPTGDDIVSAPPPQLDTVGAHQGLGGLGDKLKKPEVFIPLLSGIAAMGTAPTRSLGTALAAGLGAGTQAYQSQRKFGMEQQKLGLEGQRVGQQQQQVDISQQLADIQKLIAQGRLAEAMASARKTSAEADITAEQYKWLKGIGDGSVAASPAGSQAGVAGPAAAPTAPVTKPITAKTVNDRAAQGAYSFDYTPPTVDETILVPEDRPSVLRDQAAKFAAIPQFAGHAAQLKDKADAILSGRVLPRTISGQDAPNYAQRGADKSAYDAQLQSYIGQKNDLNQQASSFGENFPRERQLWDSLSKVYAETDTNRLSSDFADLIGRVQSIPGLKEVIPGDALKQYQSATDIATKDAARQAIVSAISAGMAQHAPAAALHQTNLTVPGPTMSPGARFEVTAQANALLDQQQQFWDDWEKNKARVTNVDAYRQDWLKEHPIDVFQKQAYERVPIFKGMTEPEIKKVRPVNANGYLMPKTPQEKASYPPGTPYVRPDGKLARVGG